MSMQVQQVTDSAPVQLRAANARDWEAIERLYRTSVQDRTSSFHIVVPTEAELRAWLDLPSPRGTFVLEHMGRIVAFGALIPFAHWAAWERTVELVVVVDREVRGCGFGKLMVEGIANHARHHGFHALMAALPCDPKMHLERFLSRLSFRQVAKLDRVMEDGRGLAFYQREGS
jgi:L-amino acid N-acyltransferase YncA